VASDECGSAWVLLFVGAVCDVCVVCDVRVRCVCEGSLQSNSIQAAGASTLAPHLGGLTALQTLE
jgi:hypothetical protein